MTASLATPIVENGLKAGEEEAEFVSGKVIVGSVVAREI